MNKTLIKYFLIAGFSILGHVFSSLDSSDSSNDMDEDNLGVDNPIKVKQNYVLVNPPLVDDVVDNKFDPQNSADDDKTIADVSVVQRILSPISISAIDLARVIITESITQGETADNWSLGLLNSADRKSPKTISMLRWAIKESCSTFAGIADISDPIKLLDSSIINDFLCMTMTNLLIASKSWDIEVYKCIYGDIRECDRLSSLQDPKSALDILILDISRSRDRRGLIAPRDIAIGLAKDPIVSDCLLMGSLYLESVLKVVRASDVGLNLLKEMPLTDFLEFFENEISGKNIYKLLPELFVRFYYSMYDFERTVQDSGNRRHILWNIRNAVFSNHKSIVHNNESA